MDIYQITLSSDDQKLAIYLAEIRQEINRANNVRNLRVCKESDLKIQIEGYGAEIAFCRIRGIEPDTTTHPRSGGADCVLPTGHRVDVKCTRFHSGKLIAHINKTIDDADIYALMIGQFPTYTLRGYSTAEEFIHERNVRDLGYGKTYVLEQSRLHKPRAAPCHLQNIKGIS